MKQGQDQARLIRMFADGELDAEETATVESRMKSDPVFAARVRFERDLRARLSLVQGASNPAPAELNERVRSRISEAFGVQEAPAVAVGSRQSWWAGPQRANVFAVAATLAIIAGAILFSLYGPTIDEISNRSDGSLTNSAFRWIWQEHEFCATDALHRSEKACWQSRTEVEQHMPVWLGTTSIPVLDLSSLGYEFVGAGPCELPGPDRSGHFIYRRAGVQSELERAPSVSIFLVADRGQFGWLDDDFADGRDVAALNLPDEVCDHLRVRSEGGLVWFLVCCRDNDIPAVEQALRESPR